MSEQQAFADLVDAVAGGAEAAPGEVDRVCQAAGRTVHEFFAESSQKAESLRASRLADDRPASKEAIAQACRVKQAEIRARTAAIGLAKAKIVTLRKQAAAERQKSDQTGPKFATPFEVARTERLRARREAARLEVSAQRLEQTIREDEAKLAETKAEREGLESKLAEL